MTDECFDILVPNKEELDANTDYEATLAKLEKMKDSQGKIIYDRIDILFETIPASVEQQITSGYANSSVDPF